MTQAPRLTEVFDVLTEAKCPECGSEGAYVGLKKVDCPNNSCRHFDPSVRPGGRQNLSKISPGKGPVSGGFQYRPFIGWARDVAKGADNVCGPNWADVIDNFLQNPDWTMTKGLRKLYDNDYTEGEATYEVLHWYDNANAGAAGYGYTALGVSGAGNSFAPEKKEDIDWSGNYPDAPRDSKTWKSFTGPDRGRGPGSNVPPKIPVKHTQRIP